MHEREKIAASLVLLALLALAAVLIQAARNEYRSVVENAPLQEIRVTVEKKPEPGSLRWRIDHECQEKGKLHTRFDMKSWLACYDELRAEMLRTDM